MATTLPRYDTSQTYRWNYDRAPQAPPGIEVPTCRGRWTVCGRPVGSPLGISAGPLLNGRWILYYAALGFDLLTYKTTRSRFHECYDLPNLQPVETGPIHAAGGSLVAMDEMRGDWAISFGMPSMEPAVWRADVEWTRQRLPKEKLLSVSVVATQQPDWTLDDLAEDFAQCARWALESGADVIETNFSCPNVSTIDGQLYQQPASAGIVAERVRAAIGKAQYSIKLGHVASDDLAAELIAAIGPHADALAMTNTISAKVLHPSGEPLFGGQSRGIGGPSIRAASLAQVALFSRILREQRLATRIIGCGGISAAAHVRDYVAAGAECVQLATAVMVDPLVGCKIRSEL
jgi:dihydroorotate dehydrogenase